MEIAQNYGGNEVTTMGIIVDHELYQFTIDIATSALDKEEIEGWMRALTSGHAHIGLLQLSTESRVTACHHAVPCPA